MRNRAVAAFSLVTVVALSGCATAKPIAAPPSVLPLHTLRLYETGVGYFERTGSVPRADQAGLPVPAGHLDDALKTLVILSAGGKVQVDGIEFGSSLSHGMARAMAGLPLEDDGPITYEELLGSLKGSRVEVHTPRAIITGRLVNVDTIAVGDDGPAGDKGKSESKDAPVHKPPRLRLTVLTDRAEVVHVDGNDIESVRPTDPAQAARLDAALEALLAHGAASHHDLRLLGTPGSQVTLGYIAETPVWRTTYRMVAGKDPGHATLQAWALLHNDTDEDWQRVQVELVNGRPDSFLFPLAAPRYGRRALVTPENELSTVPQLMGRTADTLWGDHVGDSFGAGGLGVSGVGGGGGGFGEGIGLGSISTIGHGSGTGVDGSSLLAVGDLAQVAQAKGVEAGALFVYRMPSPVALRAHASALVPFLQQSVEAEPIAWLDSPGALARAAVRFVNDTQQTLPPGTMAFFSDGGFSGESAIDRMRPAERRFLTFGADLDVEVTQAIQHTADEVQRVTFAGDDLKEHFIRTTDSDWTVENRSGLPRTVYVGLNIDRNAKLIGADSLDFDVQSGKALAVFHVPPRQSPKPKTISTEGLSRHTRLTDLTAKWLGELAALATLAPADKVVVAEAGQKQKEVEDAQLHLAEAREGQKTREED
ncbi:MAG TPA: hypothetical protein VF316_07020, partial [Polyangiaceae bacterium]